MSWLEFLTIFQSIGTIIILIISIILFIYIIIGFYKNPSAEELLNILQEENENDKKEEV